jgi:hypothetical protein
MRRFLVTADFFVCIKTLFQMFSQGKNKTHCFHYQHGSLFASLHSLFPSFEVCGSDCAKFWPDDFTIFPDLNRLI